MPGLEETLRQIVREEIRAAIDERIAGAVRDAIAPAVGGDGEDYLSATRAAAVADVSPSTIRRWWADGRLPCTGPPRLRRVRRSDLERFLERHRGNVLDFAAAAEEILKG